MKKFLSLLFLLSLLLLTSAVSSAETKEIISEGTYTMGDGETPGVAELSAFNNAKRTALEHIFKAIQEQKTISLQKMKFRSFRQG